MSQANFKALIVDKKGEGVQADIQTVEQEALPPGDVLISVAYSSLNYKDGLAVTGRGKVVRNYPMVPGIDLAGTVIESQSPNFQTGDEIIGMGWGLGETRWGGYAQQCRLQGEWLTPLPEGLNLRQAMAVGTAGFTAMVSVLALEAHGLRPEEGAEIVVTGASGGVGSMAIAILAKLGYKVVASTGRREASDYLNHLGAHEIIDRQVLAGPPERPLESGRWGGAIDVVGGDTLASLLAAMAPGTSITACGLAGGSQLNTTVFPFILRGVNLLGINAAQPSSEQRQRVWSRLTQDLSLDLLDTITQVIALKDVPAKSREILDGHIRGRVVVDVNS